MHCDTKTILDKVNSSVILVMDNCEVEYENIGEIPAEALSDDVIVVGIEARDNKVILRLKKTGIEKNDLDIDWVKEDMERTGMEPSFF